MTRCGIGRDRQFPWLCHQVVLVKFVLMRAVCRKRTLYGENRPEAEVHSASSCSTDAQVKP